MMKCIDFDSQFQKYIERWMREARSKYRNMDEMEAAMPDEYLRWLNEPAEWLDGTAPGMYFTQFNDADMLCKWMYKYINTNVPLPDQLTERLTELGEQAVAPLMELAFDATNKHDARMAALGVLNQIQSERPMAQLIDMVSHRRADDDELSDLAAEMLVNIGEKAIPAVLEAMMTAKPMAGIVLLDVACNFPGDERIYEYAVSMLRNRPEYRVLAASYLGKLGDARAIEELRPLLEFAELNYLEYLEIREAIEELGGEVETEREFAGDPYYESLRNVEAAAEGDEACECGHQHEHMHSNDGAID